MLKKRITKDIFVFLFVALFSFSSFASGSLMQMSDGGYFDPVYFQKTYPELIPIVGTDPYAEYQHYLKLGQCQGLKPFSDETAMMVQSVTYQPGFIVVPASVKTHPEAKYTLVYTDANIDIYYLNISTSKNSINNMNTGVGLYVVNKTSQELKMYGEAISINSQVRKGLCSIKVLPNSVIEDRYKCDYPATEFDSIQYATVSLKYNVDPDIRKYNEASFNILFTH